MAQKGTRGTYHIREGTSMDKRGLINGPSMVGASETAWVGNMGAYAQSLSIPISRWPQSASST